SEKQMFCLGDEEVSIESDVDDAGLNTLNNYKGVDDGAAIMLNDKAEMNPAISQAYLVYSHNTCVLTRIRILRIGYSTNKVGGKPI
ncbi:unnamed protein product, partial [Allacma fusca]